MINRAGQTAKHARRQTHARESLERVVEFGGCLALRTTRKLRVHSQD